jgi:hypothetical protein
MGLRMGPTSDRYEQLGPGGLKSWTPLTVNIYISFQLWETEDNCIMRNSTVYGIRMIKSRRMRWVGHVESIQPPLAVNIYLSFQLWETEENCIMRNATVCVIRMIK